MSRRLSFSAVVISLRWSNVVPMASRFSATKGRRSLTGAVQSRRWPDPTSLGVLLITVVMVARFLLNDASNSLLEVSAETNVSKLRNVLKISVLWSPSAETACGELDDGVARGVALAAQVAGRGVDELAERAVPPPSVVGCSESVSFSNCLRRSSHSTGTAVRSCGMVAPSASFGPPE